VASISVRGGTRLDVLDAAFAGIAAPTARTAPATPATRVRLSDFFIAYRLISFLILTVLGIFIHDSSRYMHHLLAFNNAENPEKQICKILPHDHLSVNS
jgi:hypothetical protein